MTTTTHLGITLVEQSQAQKEVTVNAALTRIDSVLNTGAKDKDLATPPGSPAQGDVYIVAASPTGAWSGQAGNVAYFDQIWRFITPREGLSLWVNDEDLIYTYNGSVWTASTLGETNTASNLGSGKGVFSGKSGVDLRFKSLVEGSNITLSSTGDEITISATGSGGGSGGYATIKEEGSSLTQRDTLNFVGSAVTASDDAGNARTNITVNAQVNALADLATSGLVARTGSGTLAARSLSAGSSKVSVSNGDGVSGNPSVDVTEANLTLGNMGGTVGTSQIAADAVTYAKMQNVSATDRLLGRATSGAGDVEEIACTAFARSLLDDADAATARATLGAGTGNGDVAGQASSVDSEIALFSGTGGKTLKRATGSGIAKVASGVFSTVASIDLGGSDASGTLAAGRFPALTGDVTTSAGALATTIANDAVTFAKMQNIASSRILGRTTASSGDVEELTAGTGITLSSGAVSVTANSTVQKVAARKNSTGGDTGTRRRLNFIEGSNVTITLADDATDDELDVTITASLTGGGYTTVAQAGSSLTQRPTLNFTGGGITASDNAGSSRTDVALTGGKQTVWIPAAAMIAATTNGASAAQVETSTNKVNVKVMDFNDSADKYAHFSITFPKSWNEGTVTYEVYWLTAGTSTNAVIWGLQGVAESDGDALDAAFGTAVTVSDSGSGTANQVLKTAESSAITLAGSPAEGDIVHFRVYRDADAGGDTLAGDARLLGVKLLFTTNAGTDD